MRNRTSSTEGEIPKALNHLCENWINMAPSPILLNVFISTSIRCVFGLSFGVFNVELNEIGFDNNINNICEYCFNKLFYNYDIVDAYDYPSRGM